MGTGPVFGEMRPGGRFDSGPYIKKKNYTSIQSSMKTQENDSSTRCTWNMTHPNMLCEFWGTIPLFGVRYRLGLKVVPACFAHLGYDTARPLYFAERGYDTASLNFGVRDR